MVRLKDPPDSCLTRSQALIHRVVQTALSDRQWHNMVGSAAAADRFAAPRRDERVSYILRAPETQHRFGISSMTLAENHLYTAGRDGTVRAWQIPYSDNSAVAAVPTDATARNSSTVGPSHAKHIRTFDEHVDWVNDVVLVKQYDRLISCSSDTTIKVWNATDSKKSLRTLVEHSDYVKALALVQNGGVASGSLDGRVLVWDLVTGSVRIECGVDAEDAQERNGSVYCMAGSVDGNILVSGSTDKTISVWDIRTGDRVVRLRGHSDSVRCLAMKHDAKLMLSGGTDSTVKLWDLRHERCIRSFDSYSNGSVWAVAANYDFNSFVSGGRDGSVWYTDMRADAESLVVQMADIDARSNMVLDVALSPCKSAVWVSTTGSTVSKWHLPPGGKIADGPNALLTSNIDERLSPVPQPQRPISSQEQTPLCQIPGLPGIIAHRIMNDRRHVLTCDTKGIYSIWDITRGTLEQSLGVIEGSNIDEVMKQRDTEVSVPSWFQVDIRLGSLTVRLDRSSVANAEIYAVDAGLDSDSEDVKVNIGEHVVRALFGKWLEEYKRREPDDAINNYRSPPTQAQKATAGRAADLPPYELPGHLPVIVTEDQVSVPILRRQVNNFQGNEEQYMPVWVVDLLRDGKGQTREAVKVSFSLSPAKGSKLPELNMTTLNAPRVLRIRKVATYIAKELKDTRKAMDIEASQLQVLCKGQVLPPTMSLATVRQFRWKSVDELCLQFKSVDDLCLQLFL